MTHRQESVRDLVRGAAGSREIAARWCVLAEQRLQHLSEMFETGRWRRYHSEIAFLENIQEAKRAVQTWRAIATGGDVAAAAASVTPAFGWSPATMPRRAPREQQAQTMQPKAVHIAPETAVPVRLAPTPNVLAEVTEAPLVPLAPSAPLAAPAAVASHCTRRRPPAQGSRGEGAADGTCREAAVRSACCVGAAHRASREVAVRRTRCNSIGCRTCSEGACRGGNAAAAILAPGGRNRRRPRARRRIHPQPRRHRSEIPAAAEYVLRGKVRRPRLFKPVILRCEAWDATRPMGSLEG